MFIIILAFFQVLLSIDSHAHAGSPVSIPDCEYKITFPLSYKKMPYQVENSSGFIFLATGKNGGYPSLRAQCLPIADRSLLSDKLIFESLNAQAESFGLREIQSFIARSPLGIIGMYTGKKEAGGIKIIQMGRLYIGDSSVLNLIATEELKNYPSNKLNSFFSSVRKISQDSNDATAEAWSKTAFSLFAKQEYDKAMNACNNAISTDPNFPRAYLIRALIWDVKKDYNSSINDYTVAINLNSNLAGAYVGRAKAWGAKGEFGLKNGFDLAISDANRALEINPKHPDAYTIRGQAFALKGQLKNAFRDFNKAIDIDPNWAEAYHMRALAWQSVGNLSNALEDAKKAVYIEPNHAPFQDHLKKLKILISRQK